MRIRDIAAYAGITAAGCGCVAAAVFWVLHPPAVVFDLQPGARFHSPFSGREPFYARHNIDPNAYGLNPNPSLPALGFRVRYNRGEWLQEGKDAVFQVCPLGLLRASGPCQVVAVVKDRFLELDRPPA